MNERIAAELERRIALLLSSLSLETEHCLLLSSHAHSATLLSQYNEELGVCVSALSNALLKREEERERERERVRECVSPLWMEISLLKSEKEGVCILLLSH